MTVKRLAIAELVIAAGLSCVFILPKPDGKQPVGIEPRLPDYVGSWYGVTTPVSAGEKEILGPDTEFARRLYTDGRGGELYASIVLSGPDMNTSIHRPERCLPAQGWTVADSRTVTIPSSQRPLNVTRLHNARTVRLQDGSTKTVYNLDYYWFVGAHETTASHLQRTMYDIRDRLLKGYNQRWAYVTVAATVTQGLQPFGHSEAETDAEIQRFISELLPRLHRADSNELASNR